jgi:large subunit ribosomal protein L28e
MSTDLQWLLVRKWNSFQVKGGHGPAFSKEKVSRGVYMRDSTRKADRASSRRIVLQGV